jgi:hypothetical protein
MPTTWKCTICRLVFPVGWFHYSLASSGPYGAAILLVCKGCGTAHAIERADSKSGCKDRFFSLREPYTDDELPPSSYSEDRSFLTIKWYMGPPHVSDWAGGEEVTTAGFTDLTCVYCHREALSDTWDERDPCPRCGGETKMVAGWMT